MSMQDLDMEKGLTWAKKFLKKDDGGRKSLSLFNFILFWQLIKIFIYIFLKKVNIWQMSIPLAFIWHCKLASKASD